MASFQRSVARLPRRAAARSRVHVGTSGWNYPAWAHSFYRGRPKRTWLRHYADFFNAVEINATFYGQQSQATFERWCDETPPHFAFSMKANRYLTHNKKLIDPSAPIQLERQRAKGLANKLKAVLWQLPKNLKKNLPRLDGFAKALKQWPEVSHAVEFRHPSWFDREVADCLAAHRVAVCISDAADWPLWDAVTSTVVYVRLHGHTRTYASAYSPKTLGGWAKRVRAWSKQGRDVHVYFDNDAEGAAPRDAQRLMNLVGLEPLSSANAQPPSKG